MAQDPGTVTLHGHQAQLGRDKRIAVTVAANGRRLGVINELIGLDQAIATKRMELEVLEGRFKKLKASL
jgi:hypothetical protein